MLYIYSWPVAYKNGNLSNICDLEFQDNSLADPEFVLSRGER